ncbi:MAG: endonuclease domain-containing protein [Blastococcus sp.]
MPVPAHAPEELLVRVFRGSTAVRSGVLTPDQLRAPIWRQIFRDVYVHRAVPDSHLLRVRAAAVLLPTAVVTGPSAAVVWGVDLAGVDDDVEMTLPPGAHPRRITGIRVRRAVLSDLDVRGRRGFRVTTPEATAVRLAALLPHDDAVVAVDQLIATGVVDLDPIRALAAVGRGPGSARARRVCTLAEGRAESPQETRLRLLMLRGGLPAPVPQFSVRIDGRFVARVDFAWPELKVAVEYDGLWHAGDRQFAEDRQRLNRLHAAGWRIVFVTTKDMRDPERLLAMIAAVLVG